MTKPFVISISGISGSGKTTVTDVLKKQLANTEVIYFDNYPGDLLGRDYCEWSESGADCNEWTLTPIIYDIEHLRSETLEYIVLDYPFGVVHRKLEAYIDLSVWIDIPLDIALARRILRDFTRRSETRRPLKGNAADEVSSYLDFYLARHRDTYLRHIDTIRPFVDFIVDGTKTPDYITNEIISVIKIHNQHNALGSKVECVFCHKENIVTDIVYEDEIVMAFMDMDPINKGHVLLVPKEHYLDVDEMPDEVLSHLMLVSKKIVTALKEIYKPDGYSIMQNGGVFNDVGHYHLHIFPRYKGDGFSWKYNSEKQEINADIARELRQKLWICSH